MQDRFDYFKVWVSLHRTKVIIGGIIMIVIIIGGIKIISGSNNKTILDKDSINKFSNIYPSKACVNNGGEGKIMGFPKGETAVILCKDGEIKQVNINN